MRFSHLSQWLEWQENLHFTEIELGLGRIAEVWNRMGGNSTLPFNVVTVAGTNGKGSSVALTSAMLQVAGYQVGTYTSPHLLAYNERISINGQPCTDSDICQAFARIDDARQEISLTYFEFATLAAADIFRQYQIDVAVFEVGMGGRLDAVNLFDADIALITPIGLDHVAWLGDNREKIGLEKAGIMRPEHPVVCSETSPPLSVIECAESLNAPIYVAGVDYLWQMEEVGWSWKTSNKQFTDLPKPALAGNYQLQNAAAVIQVCQILNTKGMSISEDAIKVGLEQVSLSGRFQVIPGDITRILDVTHNQQGADNLRSLLEENQTNGKTYAVLAMLKDKDSQAVAISLNGVIDHWYLASLDGNRGMASTLLAERITPIVEQQNVDCFDSVIEAYAAAMAASQRGDRVLIFGSFHTVEAIMLALPECQHYRDKLGGL